MPIGKGKLTLYNLSLRPRVTFLDYIFGGCEIGVHVAVDYTLSNGDVKDRSSLHYIDPRTGRNQYMDAMHSVLNILSDYDVNGMFPVYGFGGMLPDTPDNAPSHCFALNGDIFKPEVNGTKGVI